MRVENYKKDLLHYNFFNLNEHEWTLIEAQTLMWGKKRTIDKVDRRGEKDKDDEAIWGRVEGALVGGYN